MMSKKKNIAHKTERLNFAKEHEERPDDEYWQHIFWSDETNINEFGSDVVQHVWRGAGQDYHSDGGGCVC